MFQFFYKSFKGLEKKREIFFIKKVSKIQFAMTFCAKNIQIMKTCRLLIFHRKLNWLKKLKADNLRLKKPNADDLRLKKLKAYDWIS